MLLVALEPATCPCATALFGGIAGLFDHGISHNPGRLRVGPGKTQDHSGPLEPPKAGVATTASKATLHEAPTLEPATCPCATALFGGIAGLFDHGISHNPPQSQRRTKNVHYV